MNRTAIGIGQPKPHIVQQNDQNIGCILGQVALLDPPLVLRFLQRRSSAALAEGANLTGRTKSIVWTGGPPAWQYRCRQNEPEEALRN